MICCEASHYWKVSHAIVGSHIRQHWRVCTGAEAIMYTLEATALFSAPARGWALLHGTPEANRERIQIKDMITSSLPGRNYGNLWSGDSVRSPAVASASPSPSSFGVCDSLGNLGGAREDVFWRFPVPSGDWAWILGPRDAGTFGQPIGVHLHTRGKWPRCEVVHLVWYGGSNHWLWVAVQVVLAHIVVCSIQHTRILHGI